MNVHTHPADDVLAAYVQGRLPPDDAALLDTHLSDCGDCVKKLDSVGSDTFSDLLRQPTSVDTAVQGVAFPELPPELRNHARYEIVAKLGQGGMGVVYKAKHRMMSRAVALKLIRTDLLSTPVAVARFRREVQAAAKLAHPNIVTAHDAEEIGGVHFLVMEYVEGRTLDRIVRKRGPLPVAIACSLARQAALGLDHAHSHGMVHRDIKPQNLIVTEKSKLKILDFGLALWTDGAATTLTGTNATLGTLLYAAPEQTRTAGEVDGRADLYGLGATLYFLLTGNPPLKKDTDTGSYEMPTALPPEVVAIIEKLMARDPNDRYSTAKEVAEALAPWCSTAPREADVKPDYRKWTALAVGVLIVGISLAFAIPRRDRSAGSIAPIVSEVTVVEPPWKSLIPQIDLTRDSVAGDWKRMGNELAARAYRGSRIMLPARPTGEYDLRITFTRNWGKHSVGAVIVHGGRQVSFELDAWEQHFAGFQEIYGNTIVNNPTRRDGYELINRRKYVLELKVRAKSIQALLDGQEVCRHETDGSDLSLNQQYWGLPDPKALALLAWESEVIFHNVELKNR